MCKSDQNMPNTLEICFNANIHVAGSVNHHVASGLSIASGRTLACKSYIHVADIVTHPAVSSAQRVAYSVTVTAANAIIFES